jgi:hypothetical protein
LSRLGIAKLIPYFFFTNDNNFVGASWFAYWTLDLRLRQDHKFLPCSATLATKPIDRKITTLSTEERPSAYREARRCVYAERRTVPNLALRGGPRFAVEHIPVAIAKQSRHAVRATAMRGELSCQASLPHAPQARGASRIGSRPWRS